jgi:hypothetical protein
MIDATSLEHIASYCEGMDIDSIWYYFDKPNGAILKNDYINFDERREAFLWTVKQLVEHNYIRLAEMGKPKNFLNGTVDENIDLLRQAFPKDDEGMHGGLWFFFDDCPVGCNWYAEWNGNPIPFV